MNAKAGDHVVVEASRLLKAQSEACFRRCFVALVVGIVVGATVAASVAARADPSKVVSGALCKAGEHLCRDFEGLRDIQPLGSNRYDFNCRVHAIVKDVEVTTKE